MAQRNDILINDDGSFKSSGGDFLIQDNTIEQTARIVVSDDGHRKGFPDLGAGIWKFLNAPVPRGLVEATIINELKSDGIRKPNVDASDFNNIIVNELTISSDG